MVSISCIHWTYGVEGFWNTSCRFILDTIFSVSAVKSYIWKNSTLSPFIFGKWVLTRGMHRKTEFAPSWASHMRACFWKMERLRAESEQLHDSGPFSENMVSILKRLNVSTLLDALKNKAILLQNELRVKAIVICDLLSLSDILTHFLVNKHIVA